MHCLSSHQPETVQDEYLLHDPGNLHDPFIHDTVIIMPLKARENRTDVLNVRRCTARGCTDAVNPTARNERHRALCEKHKRVASVRCADGEEVSFCFYCNKTHPVERFTIKTNICDVQYIKRREKNRERERVIRSS